jgi:hypothetical protein
VFRYLQAAFWVKPELPGIGRVPLNALGAAGFAILGVGHPGFWLLGLALEAAWLWGATQSGRFRALVDARAGVLAAPAMDGERATLLARVGPESRARIVRLEQNCSRALQLQRDAQRAELLVDMNRDALAKLTNVALKLLAARESLIALGRSTNEDELRRQIAALERDLADDSISDATRDSKEATVRLLRQRLANLDRREQSLEEIDSDLARIEAQVDLAVDHAGLRGQDATVSSDLAFVSHFLDEPLGSEALPPIRSRSKSRLPEG